MALTQCEDCGGKLSTEAEACPHCGRPNKPPLPAKEPSTKCAGCGSWISAEDAACPHCGRPNKPAPEQPPPQTQMKSSRATGGIGCLLILGVVLLALFISNVTKERPRSKTVAPEAVAPEAIQAVREWYRKWPVGGGWKVTSVRARGRRIEVRVAIPTASHLMDLPSERQFRAVSVACPSKLEPVWEGLRPSEDIEVQGTTLGGKVFIDVSCRNWW